MHWSCNKKNLFFKFSKIFTTTRQNPEKNNFTKFEQFRWSKAIKNSRKEDSRTIIYQNLTFSQVKSHGKLLKISFAKFKNQFSRIQIMHFYQKPKKHRFWFYLSFKSVILTSHNEICQIKSKIPEIGFLTRFTQKLKTNLNWKTLALFLTKKSENNLL